MKSSKPAFLFYTAILGLSLNAHAATPEQSCPEIGITDEADDQSVTLACLYNKAHHKVWTDLLAHHHDAAAVAPAPVPVAAVTSSNEKTVSQPNHKSRWQGWYAGVNAGASDTETSYTLLGPNQQDYTRDLRSIGGTAGIVGGYNVVRKNGLFYGAEADVNYLSNSKNEDNLISKWNGYATLRGRVGLATDPALVYLTGGLALVDSIHKFNSAFLSSPTPIYYGFSSTTIHPGWTIGAGTEFALTDNISFDIKYMRLEVPEYTKKTSYTYIAATSNYQYLIDDSADIVRVGLNWHFDNPSE